MQKSWKFVVCLRVARRLGVIAVIALAMPCIALADETNGTSSDQAVDGDAAVESVSDELAQIAAEFVAMQSDGDRRGGAGRSTGRSAGRGGGMRSPQPGRPNSGPPNVHPRGPRPGGLHGRPPHRASAWGRGPRGIGPPQRGAYSASPGRNRGPAALDARLRSIERKLDVLIAESRRRGATDGRGQQARPQSPPSRDRRATPQRSEASERRGSRESGPGGLGGFRGPPQQNGRGGRGSFGSGFGSSFGPGPGGRGGFGGIGPQRGPGFGRPGGDARPQRGEAERDRNSNDDGDKDGDDNKDRDGERRDNDRSGRR